MLFRRRKPAGLRERLRTLFWPRRSFWRSAQYYAKRVLRLTATPHAIAAGVAAGVFTSFLPFVGFHFIIAAILAWIIAGNILASAIGTAVGNPLTFPFIWGSTYEIGRFILEGRGPGEPRNIELVRLLRHLDFAQLWEPLIKPMTVGGVTLGLLFGMVFYVLTRWATIAFREQRRKRLADKARRRAGLPDGVTVRG
jgi:uncharacterized protein